MSTPARHVDLTALCCCGIRRGMHRFGDEACPNRDWLEQPGSGKPQWREVAFHPHPRPHEVAPFEREAVSP
jgi:hypothetical protein